jgi:hypothetical protein
MMLAICAALAACSGDDDAPEPSPTTSPAETVTATATAPPPTSTPPPWPVAAVLPERGRAHITTDNLNVRVGPSTTAAAIGLLEPGDEVALAGRSADSQWLAIVNTGWIAHRPEWMTLTTPLATLPEVGPHDVVPPTHARGTSSGYPAVDVVIEPAVTGDIPRLARMAQLLSTQCAAAPGSGGPPPCSLRPGTTPGAMIEVFPAAVCEGEHILAENVPRFLARLYESGGASNAPLSLYAVIEAPRQQSAFFPEGRWVAILQLPDGTGRSLGVTELGLVRADLGCQAQATDLLMRRPFESPVFVLPPVLTAPVRPRP